MRGVQDESKDGKWAFVEQPFIYTRLAGQNWMLAPGWNEGDVVSLGCLTLLAEKWRFHEAS